MPFPRESAVFLLFSLFPFIYATCPTGTIYESSFNKCYGVFPAPASFLPAEQECINLGGHLTSLQNAYEASFVSAIVSEQTNSGSYWIGLNLLMKPTWSWADNSSLSYTNWAPGQPADPNNFQCGSVNTTMNYWTKDLCYNKKPFVCAIDPNATPGCPMPSPTPMPVCSEHVTCDFGYTLLGDCKCYKYIFDHERTFNFSVDYCAQENATLPIIQNAVQNDIILKFSNYSYRGGDPWLGMRCEDGIRANCVWVNGQTIGYTNFLGGEPRKTAPAVFMYVVDGGKGEWGKWATTYEFEPGATLCQKDPISSPLEEESIEKWSNPIIPR